MTTASESYHKVGNTISDDFFYLDFTRSRVTGKTNASFTKRLTKDGVGNQSTTGITISEVDATNNPGWYHVDISASTGFPASTGAFELEVFDTSDNRLVWAKTYRVTSDGTGAGTTGPVSFTAVAANGRVTDGTSALSGATVLVKRSTGTIYTSFTSDASGLWGPVYFTDADTYTLSVFKSGYSTSNSGTITVTGTPASAVTGPLTDIAITVTSSGSGLTFSDLIAYARRMARNASGSQSDTELKECVNDALAMICQDHLWPHYKTHGTLSLNARQTTGTIAIANGGTNAVLTGATWPTTAALGKILVNGQVQRISSRTSGSTVVITNAWQEASVTAGTYVYFQDEYTLPSDLMRFGCLIPGQSHPFGTGQPVGFEQLLQLQCELAQTDAFPLFWCVHGSGGTDKIMLYPAPSSNFLLPFWYYRRPATLVNGSDEADWMPGHVQLLHRAIDYQVAIHYAGSVAGGKDDCQKAYKDALSTAIAHDQTAVRQPSPTRTPAGPFKGWPGNFRVTS